MNKNNDLLEHIKTGILLMEGSPLQVSYANRQIKLWFSRGAEKKIDQGLFFNELFPNVNLDRLFKRIKKGRQANFVIDFNIDQKILTIQFSMSKTLQGQFILEGHDHSAMKEIEMMLASYSKLIESKNKLLEKERRRVERLLFNILPEKSIRQLRQFGHTIPEHFNDVSVMFLDFVGFTTLSRQLSTEDLFTELNDIFTAFDVIIKKHQCERIKTIGDAYLAVCGMPEKVNDHPKLLVCAAYQMLAYIKERNCNSSHQWQCRIGIHTGEVTGGVVGQLKYIYDIFGDGVNTASRMETYSEAMKINLSSLTHQRLDEDYQCIDRGLIDVKGKGEMRMFFLDHIIGVPCEGNLIENLPKLSAQDTIENDYFD